ncbi:hypothetical protein [Brevundimonas sp.]|uniref:hypothetical protein n=1 Tax=Brevundimonas sp. TaxID=1871086 RepID=UPI0035AFBB23
MAGPIHYELYVRKTAPAPWGLQMATEDRSQAIEQAETLLADGDVVAVRVTKETLDPDTMEFQSVTVLTKGAPEMKKKKLVRDDGQQSNCLSPTDVYAPHARDLIGRVLEDWLVRQGVTVFELLHRADLAELLDASGVELQHAIQKVAVPESQDTGQSVHDLVRHYQKLAEATIARIITTERKGRFPDLTKADLARTAEKLAGESDRAFLMGGAIARRLCEVRGPRARLNALMDMAEAAPPAGPAKALVYIVLDQILAEMATQRAAMADILGPSLDPGAVMAATVAMLAPDETALVIQASPAVAQDLPVIEGAAKRLAERLGSGLLPQTRATLARQMMRELRGPRRLKPRDAAGEIDVLRVLATLLTATGDTLLTAEEVQTAFVERSKSLVTADFVGQYTGCFEGVAAEAEALLRLCENVTGASSKRAAARWFLASITSLKFESDLLSPVHEDTPARRLQRLARLQKEAGGAGLSETDTDDIAQALGQLAATLEARAGLTAAIARSRATPSQKLALLLRMAMGETAPLGPVADRARAEALKLLRSPDTRGALASQPSEVAVLKPMLQAVGLAA